jgi:cytochrome c oxidase subunit I
LLLFAGFLVTARGGGLAGYDGAPWHVVTYTGPNAHDWVNYARLDTVGGVMVGLGLLVFVGNVTLAWFGARAASPEDRPGDPYQADTLEWFTSSPPPEDDFEVLPEIRSAAPTADWRREQAPAGSVS